MVPPRRTESAENCRIVVSGACKLPQMMESPLDSCFEMKQEPNVNFRKTKTNIHAGTDR